MKILEVEQNNNVENKPVNPELKKASQEFEALFINMLLKQMRKTVQNDGVLPDSFSTKTYKEMYDNQIAKTMSKSNKIGIAKYLYNQFYDQASKDPNNIKQAFGKLKQDELYSKMQTLKANSNNKMLDSIF